jgi:two-component system, chemotaxis family, protein-glutamate methylesterase/glutaminase
MAATGRNIIAIGTSAGGLRALDELIGQLPTDLRASIFVVQHLAPEATGDALLQRLGRHKWLDGRLATHGEVFKQGRLYIAPPDYHMLVKEKQILVTKGARENRYRPAIDPLFRSAAVSHGPRVIGVVLTGMLDDGTAGLLAIKRCGGVTVVQDPESAAYKEMPRSALNGLDVDHCVPLSQLGGVIGTLARARSGKRVRVPPDVKSEAEIAERVLSDVAQVERLGTQVPYNCPNCGGVLWKVEGEAQRNPGHRYRCHTGHSFTASALLDSQSEKIEETLWVSLRMLEERKNLLNNMADTERSASRKASYAERAEETEVHIDRVRAMLLAREPKLADRKPADR